MTGTRTRRVAWWTTVIVLIAATLSALAIGLWQAVEGRQIERAQNASARESVLEVARSNTITMLSYQRDTVEAQLTGSLPLLTGDFRESYDKLIHDVVIPGAQQKNISAVAQVPAIAVESLSQDRAVRRRLYQPDSHGRDSGTENTASSVRISMQKIDGKWLIDEFEPV